MAMIPQHVAGLDQRLEKIPDVLNELRRRRDQRVNQLFEGTKHIGMRYEGQANNGEDSPFVCRVDGRDMRVARTAIRGACDIIGFKPAQFERFADPDALPKALINIIDDNHSRKDKSILVRHDGIRINAILPGRYQIQDDYDMLSGFTEEIANSYGEDGIHGVERLASSEPGSHTSYRVVLGEDILGSGNTFFKQLKTGDHTFLKKNESPMFTMFVLSCSELGIEKTEVTLGLYRLVCRNGAMRLDQRAIVAKWDHLRPAGKFFEKSFDIIRRSGFFQNVCGRIFNELRVQPLEIDAFNLLSALKDENYLGQEHFDCASRYCLSGIDSDNGTKREIKTAFEFFNCLTRSAQDVGSLKLRQKAESDAMRIALHPGSFSALLSDDRQARKANVDLI